MRQIALQVLLQEGEAGGEAGANVRQGAAGVDEIESDYFAAQVGKAEGRAMLVCELEIGDGIAGFKAFFG